MILLLSWVHTGRRSVLSSSQLYSPAKIIVVDMDDNRLALAREMGANT